MQFSGLQFTYLPFCSTAFSKWKVVKCNLNPSTETTQNRTLQPCNRTWCCCVLCVSKYIQLKLFQNHIGHGNNCHSRGKYCCLVQYNLWARENIFRPIFRTWFSVWNFSRPVDDITYLILWIFSEGFLMFCICFHVILLCFYGGCGSNNQATHAFWQNDNMETGRCWIFIQYIEECHELYLGLLLLHLIRLQKFQHTHIKHGRHKLEAVNNIWVFTLHTYREWREV